MKKTILTAIALLCLSTPLQAEDFPCFILDVPCYVKSGATILRKEPSEDSPIVQQLSPARDSDRLYYYLRVRMQIKGKWWGYFESVEPIVDLITGKMMAGGWAPLANAFHDLDESSSANVIKDDKQEVAVEFMVFKPNTRTYGIETKDSAIILPVRPENIVQKPKN